MVALQWRRRWLVAVRSTRPGCRGSTSGQRSRAGITKPFRPFHDLRHTALTLEAAVNPAMYVQLKAGHSQAPITERYIHAAQVLFPGAAQRGKDRLFAELPGPKLDQSSG
jgi:integrase